MNYEPQTFNYEPKKSSAIILQTQFLQSITKQHRPPKKKSTPRPKSLTFQLSRRNRDRQRNLV